MSSESAKAMNARQEENFESAKETCEEENATLGLPEEPEHTLHVPVWINLVRRVGRSWKADGGLNQSKYFNDDTVSFFQPTYIISSLVLNSVIA